MNQLQQLRERRDSITAQLRALVDNNPGDKWTPEHTAQYDRGLQDIDKIDAEIARHIRLQNVAAAQTAAIEAGADARGTTLTAERDRAEFEMRAFLNWCARDLKGIEDAEERNFVASRLNKIQGAGVGTGAAGGFTVPQAFLTVLETAMRDYGGVRDVATIISTESGADMPFPTNNDTGNSATILAENTAMSTVDVTFGQATLRAFMFATGIVPVSLQLLQDTAFDMGSWLAQQLGTRLARGENTQFTTGAGTTAAPQGFANATVGATIGHTLPTGNTTGFTYNGLVTVEHSIDPAYRRLPSCVWMMSDIALRQVRLILDSQNRPIFVPGYQVGQIGAVGGAPDTLMGRRIVINQDMPVPAANARSIAIGDFSRYYVRNVLGAQVRRLDERYAEALQVAFIGYHRADGRLIDAGTNPIRLLQNSAT